MDPSFAHVVESLHPSFVKLTEGDPLPRKGATHFPRTGGVYLISEAGRHLYVGRSRNLRNRFDAHRSLSSRMQSAPLAVALARQATKYTKATYAPGEGSWNWLREHPPFIEAFLAAKARVRAMEFRYVEETDAIRQTVLEVYCAVVLQTPYNKFETT